MGGAAIAIPGGAPVAAGHDAVNLDELRRARPVELQFTLATPPFAGGADLTSCRHIIHPIAPNR